MKNKKILYILSGNEPSGFVRARIFREEFEKRGITADYIQLKSDFLIKTMFRVKPLLLAKLLLELLVQINYSLKRFYLMRLVADYDVIIAVKYIKSKLLTQIKAKSDAVLVYDFDDSVWLNGFDGEEEFERKIKTADCITSGNSYLAKRASVYNPNSFEVNAPCQVEKFIDTENFVKPVNGTEKEVVIGWIGSASTLFSLYKIYDALEHIGERYPNVVLKLVGTGKDGKMVPRFEKIRVRTVSAYDQEEMVKQVSSFDIGLYPLFMSELSLGRGPLKARIYMAGKVPVICSSYIENNRFIEDGVTGFFANNTNEWIEKMSLLIDNQELRKQVGENAFNYALENCSVENSVTQFLNAVSQHVN